jgi:hypothetical protein
MHLSTVHGSSYYSAGINSASTLVRRAETSSNNMWIAIGAGVFVLFVLLYIGHAFAQRKFNKSLRQKNHAQWYGQHA